MVWSNFFVIIHPNDSIATVLQVKWGLDHQIEGHCMVLIQDSVMTNQIFHAIDALLMCVKVTVTGESKL